MEDSVVRARLIIVVLHLAALLACASHSSGRVDREALRGPWSSGGPSFDFSIGETTILFEFDMREHPYRLEGDVLVVEFDDPAIGTVRSRIIRVTEDLLELEYEAHGERRIYTKMR